VERKLEQVEEFEAKIRRNWVRASAIEQRSDLSFLIHQSMRSANGGPHSSIETEQEEEADAEEDDNDDDDEANEDKVEEEDDDADLVGFRFNNW
jgi:hypothetical protein